VSGIREQRLSHRSMDPVESPVAGIISQWWTCARPDDPIADPALETEAERQPRMAWEAEGIAEAQPRLSPASISM